MPTRSGKASSNRSLRVGVDRIAPLIRILASLETTLAALKKGMK